MIFETFSLGWIIFLASGFGIALTMGYVVSKTHFCTMGGVSDFINMGHFGRFRAWLLAMAVAILGVTLLEPLGAVLVNSTFPPYRSGTLVWAENILGGLMFGVGMTLGSGCGNKTLVRFGTGNMKSIVVLLVIAVIAFYMLNPLPGTDQTLYSLLFYPWMQPLAIDLGQAQDLGYLLTPETHTLQGRLVLGLLAAAALFTFVFKSAEFRKDSDNLIAGTVVGVAVLAAWVITSSIQINADDALVSLNAYHGEWDFLQVDDSAIKPIVAAPLNPQSFTFINPLGQSLGFLASGGQSSYLTFGILSVFGVLVGSFLYGLVHKQLRLEWFANGRDFINHLIGAALMGFGGVLGMGCTVGQGITGVSTLALGSILTVLSIVFACMMTLKVQYYRMMYEDEASFSKALVAGLIDLKLLPQRFRQLDKI